MTAISCRSCGQAPLVPVLDLGTTPLANALLNDEQLKEPEPRFPLELAFCPSCTLVQITHSVDPARLFRHYFYLSSFSDSMLESARQIARRLVAERNLGPESLVIEVASNDGYLLKHYVEAGVPVLGVEPARNIAEIAEQAGIRTVAEFYGDELAHSLRDQFGPADVLHANNVLAHVPDLNGFVAGIATSLKPDGVAVIEAPHVKELIDHVEFDTIYHEHLCYLSLLAMRSLFARHGLQIVDVERIPLHGGSLRLFAARGGQPSAAVTALLHEELAAGLDRPEYYQGFSERVARLRGALVDLLGDLKSQGRRIAAYGASAKGSTLLNYCGIGRETLEYVADRSTAKQGHYTPGAHLPIVEPARLVEDRPDYVLLLTWNFAEEILAQQKGYREAGGRFVIPVPTPTVV